MTPSTARRHRRPGRTLAALPSLERRPARQRSGALPSHDPDDPDDAGIHPALGGMP